MGIDWMTNEELAEAIPPYYAEYLGRCVLEKLRRQKLGPEARKLIWSLGRPGRPRKGTEKRADGTLKRGTNSRAYILARLERDGFGELAARVHAGEMSAAAAAPGSARQRRRMSERLPSPRRRPFPGLEPA